MIRALALAIVMAAPAAAQEFPGLFDVTGVASDDVLNIRAEPRGSSAKVGAFAPDRVGIEVSSVTPDRRWGRVLAADTSGWVAMRFLAPNPEDTGSGLPDRLSCAGTEPFWSLSLDTGRDRHRFEQFATDAPARDLFTDWMHNLAFGPVRGGALRMSDAGGGVTAFVRPGECSDGMSDFLFGWKVLVVEGDGPSSRAFSGCCTADFARAR